MKKMSIVFQFETIHPRKMFQKSQQQQKKVLSMIYLSKIFSEKTLTHFSQRFSGVFRGYKMRTFTRNELRNRLINLRIHFSELLANQTWT